MTGAALSPARGYAYRGPVDRFALDQQLCFALYSASRAMISCYRPLLDRLGLTYPQYLVMLLLWERGESTVSGLGAALQLESGTLSPLLKRLENNGLVARSRVPDDERSVLISLTERGRALREQVEDVPTEVERATGMAREEIAVLRESLHSLAARLRTVPSEDL
jgi:MarR family transcriptional regulator, organic hydroperoxide resistance regulator